MAELHRESKLSGQRVASFDAGASRYLELTNTRSSTSALSAASGGRVGAAANSREATGAATLSGNYVPNGWRIKPAGKQVRVFNFPVGLAVSPDGATAVVSSGNGGMQGLTAIDTKSLRAIPEPAGNLFMGVSFSDQGRLYASGGNADRVFRYVMRGGVLVPLDLTEAATFPVHHALDAAAAQSRGALPDHLPAGDGVRLTGYPGNSVSDGRYVYVAGTLSEPSGAGTAQCNDSEKACARVSVIDSTNDTVVGRATVGRDAFALALDSARHRLYVTNWGDEAGRGHNTGTVSVVDITNPAVPREVSVTRVGHHPSAVQLSADRTRLFVADTNDDAVSVLDVSGATPHVIATESVRPTDGLAIGAKPVAFALSPDGDTLFVALAGMNAVEVRDGRTAGRLAAAPVYIPTGWYPSALMVTGTADHYRLWVTNAKGAGASKRSTGYNVSVGQELSPLDGTVSVIDLPAPSATTNEWTETVRDNDRLDDVDV
ncbi:MAG: hypothetical protein QOF21_3354, partial [Actinomycetota bacterium]